MQTQPVRAGRSRARRQHPGERPWASQGRSPRGGPASRLTSRVDRSPGRPPSSGAAGSAAFADWSPPLRHMHLSLLRASPSSIAHFLTARSSPLRDLFLASERPLTNTNVSLRPVAPPLPGCRPRGFCPSPIHFLPPGGPPRPAGRVLSEVSPDRPECHPRTGFLRPASSFRPCALVAA